MKKEKFIDAYVRDLIEKDPDIKRYFAKAPKERSRLEVGLRESLGNAYDAYAKEYFDSKGLGSYFATFLRLGGAAADIAGTYMFWALGGAGFGLKGLGLGVKSLADVVEGYHYERHAKPDSLAERVKDTAVVAGEGLAERAAAYLPLGVGELSDLLRGAKKYDTRITLKAIYHAKNEFIKKFGEYKSPELPKIISLDAFRDPRYATLETRLKKAA